MKRTAALSLAGLAVLAGCAAARGWQRDVVAAIGDARREERDLVVFFALPGRVASDRMQRALDDPAVLEALAAGAFAAVVADGTARATLYREWIGGGEGMGIAVLDGAGRCYAARPGPQDPGELAAFLRTCTAAREQIAALRRALAQPAVGPVDQHVDQHALGCLLLELGNRTESEAHLLAAATAGVTDARHRLARLYALDGDVANARRWLAGVPPTPPALVTEGYVRFKERRHADAVAAFERALRDGGAKLGADRQRALLYLGKSLHEQKDDARATPILEALAAEGSGSTFEAAAVHTLGHIRDPQHGHSH